MIHNTMNGLTSLSRLSDAKTRSICPENRTGAKGCGGMATEGTGKSCARDLGIGWKVSPSIDIAPGDTLVMADVDGPAIIKHIWITGRFLCQRGHRDLPPAHQPSGLR